MCVCGVGGARDRKSKVLISFSTKVGHKVGVTVQERFGKLILELGGNNAVIVDNTASVESVVSGLMTGCIMTNGQCCTSTRRLVRCTRRVCVCVRVQLCYRYLSLFMRVCTMKWWNN